MSLLKSGIVIGTIGFAAGCGSSSPAATTPAPDTTVVAAADGADAVMPSPMSVHVSTHPSQGEVRVVEGATASLLSVKEGAMLHMETSGLAAGSVYTAWAIIVNNPSACATSPCTAKDVLGNSEAVQSEVTWAAGGVANDDGTIAFTGWVNANDKENTWYNRGLIDPTTAEIHIVVNSHGALIVGREAKMLTTYREGCTDESLPPPFPDTAKADGVAGPNKCALTQVAIFQQGK